MNSDIKGERSAPTIESTIPRPWEVEETFHDSLYDWLERAPWFAISAAAHLVVLLIIQAIPWNLFEREQVHILEASVDVPSQMDFLDPPDEPMEPVEVHEDPLEEPVIMDLPQEDPSPVEFVDSEPAEGNPEFFSDAPFKAMGVQSILGVGGPPGGKYGQRFRGNGGPGGGKRRSDPRVDRALRWLADHQDDDGSWDSDGFMKHDPPSDPCEGPGSALHDVGVTSLALLAFLGDGNTMREGPYRDNVSRGVRWLRGIQDPDNGRVPDPIGKHYIYDHALATLALSEAYALSPVAPLRRPTQAALGFCMRSRAPYGAWRYDIPSVGAQDTSVTGWMIFALQAGSEAGLQVDEDALAGGLAWIDEATDPVTGRVGYDVIGSSSSRIMGINDHFPVDGAESMTAVGLLCRFFLGQTPEESPIMERHADLLLENLPEWDPEGGRCDMYYWYYGTYAMWQMGGRWWKQWNRAMEPVVVSSQRKDGVHAGSWDPLGPWGHSGGRVYSTAMMTLCLQVTYRYSRLLGAR